MSEIAQRMPELAKGLWSYTDDWDSDETNALVAEMFLGETSVEITLAFQENSSDAKQKK